MTPIAAQHRRAILKQMDAAGLNISQLARLAGINRPWLSNWLSGRVKNCQTDTLDRLYKGLRKAGR